MKPEQLEIERLRREVAKLKAERDILKSRRLAGLRPPSAPRRTRYEVRLHREAPRDLAGGMDVWALGVSRSGFHAWPNRAPSQRARDDEVIGARVKTSHITKPQHHLQTQAARTEGQDWDFPTIQKQAFR